MAKELYCWRCDTILPMVSEEEWSQLEPLLNRSIEDVKSYRETHGVGLAEARDIALGASALEFYFALTGFRETNVNALWHHRLSIYGPPCAACGKPLRTPQANLCASCGASRNV